MGRPRSAAPTITPVKYSLWVGAARIVLEGEREQSYSADTREDRNSRGRSQAEESTAATATCCDYRRRISDCRCSSTLREADIQHAASSRISLTGRALLRRNLTIRLLLCRQDRAAVNKHRF